MGAVPLRRALGAALLTLAVACSSGGGSSTDPSPVPATNAATARLLPTDAAALPSFDLPSYRQLLSELHGTPVVVNVWASWCGPCRQEAPHLAEASKAFGDRVQFLGIDILDARGSARGFMKEYGWTYPSLFDETGAIRDGLGLLGQPATVFYDAAGDEVGHWSGPIPSAELFRRLRRLAPSA